VRGKCYVIPDNGELLNVLTSHSTKYGPNDTPH